MTEKNDILKVGHLDVLRLMIRTERMKTEELTIQKLEERRRFRVANLDDKTSDFEITKGQKLIVVWL